MDNNDSIDKVKLLLVPWVKGWSIITRIYKSPAESIYEVAAEIRGGARKNIAVALLNKYPKKLCLFTAVRSPRVAVEVAVPKKEVERLLRALNILSTFKSGALKRKRAKELLDCPTLDELESFLAIEKVLGE